MKEVAVGAILVLSGCGVTPDSLSHANLTAESRRAVEAAYMSQPFAEGAVHVVSEERGEMRTYLLVPCRGGERVCAGSLHGQAGHAVPGPDFVTVTGAYHGRTFFLRPGGSGVLQRQGINTPLAWD